MPDLSKGEVLYLAAVSKYLKLLSELEPVQLWARVRGDARIDVSEDRVRQALGSEVYPYPPEEEEE